MPKGSRDDRYIFCYGATSDLLRHPFTCQRVAFCVRGSHLEDTWSSVNSSSYSACLPVVSTLSTSFNSKTTIPR